MLTIEPLGDVAGWAHKAQALLSANQAEVESDIPADLDPRLEVYTAVEATGSMLALGLFDDGEIVGYSINLVTASLHYGGLVECVNDVLYVAPEHRAGGGLKLIRETETQAAVMGAKFMVWQAKPGTNLDRLLPRRGYAMLETKYGRLI